MKNIRELVQVHCSGKRPVAFRRTRQKTYMIERVLRVWIVQTAWWADEVHHTYYEVVVKGGVYLLRCQDRASNKWHLLGIQD